MKNTIVNNKEWIDYNGVRYVKEDKWIPISEYEYEMGDVDLWLEDNTREIDCYLWKDEGEEAFWAHYVYWDDETPVTPQPTHFRLIPKGPNE